MKRSRFSEEQIIGILKEHEAGVSVADLCRKHGVTSLTQARVALGCWQADYNGSRPHSQLGWKTPAEFALTFHPSRDLALRSAEGSAPAPVASTARSGKSNRRSELRTG